MSFFQIIINDVNVSVSCLF